MSIANVGEDSKFAKYLKTQIEKKIDGPESTGKSIFEVFNGDNDNGGIGSSIVKYAKKFIGANESDGSADKFLGGGNSSSTPWCAAFVQYIMEHVSGGKKMPSWYKKISNKWYCPNVLNAAQNAHATVKTNKAKPGDIVLFGDHHIGIVKSNKNGIITTIEGNSSNQVKSNSYSSTDGSLTICKMT